MFFFVKSCCMLEKHNKDSKNTYLLLIVLLISSFIFFVMYSYAEKDRKDGFLVCWDIENFFKTEKAVTIIEEHETIVSVDSVIKDTVPKNILLLGDSMVEGLSVAIGKYAAKNGHKLNSVIWYSSTSKTWSLTDTLDFFIDKFSPDFIMVSLGGNELFVNDLDRREKYASDIVSRIGDIPFVWIGPPNWRPDTGINDRYLNVVGVGRYFYSGNLNLERGGDGRHPSAFGYKVWTDTIASWLENTSRYHLLMLPPDSDTKKVGRVTVLSNAKF